MLEQTRVWIFITAGDQYFGIGNSTTSSAQKRPRGSVSVGVNSGLVNVDTNSGVLDVGNNTPKGQLKVAYNGPNGPRPMNNDTTIRNRHDSKYIHKNN